MQNFAKIHKNDISHIEKRMKNFHEDEVVERWIDITVENFNHLLEKYEIEKFILNQNSYMGVVLDCIDSSANHYIMKNVPFFLNRFEAEILCLLKLPKEVRCKIYEYDTYSCMIVMEKVEPGNSAHFFGLEKEYEILFNILYANKIEVSDVSSSKSFWEVVEFDYNKLLSLTNNENCEDIKTAKEYFEILQKHQLYFKNEIVYHLHGDIHRNNAIVGKDGIKLVDPLGFSAPFVFEFGALCAYELYDTCVENFDNVLSKFYDFVAKFEDKNNFLIALFDVVIKMFIPSLFEANDNHKKSSKLLLVLDFLAKELHKLK